MKSIFSFFIILMLIVMSTFIPLIRAERAMILVKSDKHTAEDVSDGTEYYALIGGCLRYQNESFNIASGNSSVETYHRYIYDSLLSSSNWKEQNILLLTDENATREKVVSALGYFAEIADADDVFLFSWHSHGNQVKDIDGDEAVVRPDDTFDEVILPYNVDIINGSLTNYISDDELGSYLEAFTVEAMVIIVEACFCGGLVDEEPSQILDINAPGRIVMMSTPPNHLGWIHPIDAFGWMSSLGFALSTPLSDMNHDGWISAEEAFRLASPVYTFRTYLWMHLLPFMLGFSASYAFIRFIQLLLDKDGLSSNFRVLLSVLIGYLIVWYTEHASEFQGLPPAANRATLRDEYNADLQFLQIS